MPARFRAASITAICMPKQMPKYGTLRVAREGDGVDLAFRAALAEAARHQDAVHPLQIGRRVLLLEDLALDPVEVDLHLVGDAAMLERLDQRFVGVLQAGVLADDRRSSPRLPAGGCACVMPRQRSRSGSARRLHRRRPPALRGRAPPRDRRSARRRWSRRRAPGSPPLRAHCRTARACAGRSSGIGRSQRTSRMSGWMPMERSSLTECCVGLVFSSPADGDVGHQRQVDVDAVRRAAARCRAGGSPRRTAAPRCRRPCRRSRRARNRSPRCRRGRMP